MVDLLHRSPSVGGVIKKILAINPNLTTQEVIDLVRQSIQTRGSSAGEFSTAEVVDEAKALQLAHKTKNKRES